MKFLKIFYIIKNENNVKLVPYRKKMILREKQNFVPYHFTVEQFRKSILNIVEDQDFFMFVYFLCIQY